VPGAADHLEPGPARRPHSPAGGTDGFDVGGAQVEFSGIPQGMHNVLRDLQDSPLGQKANQLESMTIEMVAMLFDFIFETKDLPDGIKALLARLQIPVLKAAMLDGAFFAKKTHPSRLLVNQLAQAGSAGRRDGADDPLYRKIDEIVHQILDNFSDDLAIFDEQRESLEAFLAEEEKAAEENIQTTAEEINKKDRLQIGSVLAKGEIEKRIEQMPVPQFLAMFLRMRWQGALEHVYLDQGEESDAWTGGIATLEDLVWSVQPKRSVEDRRHLVALLPSLLKRLSAGMQHRGWAVDDREAFMSNLVEAHAAAVKPSVTRTARRPRRWRKRLARKPRSQRRRATRSRRPRRKRSRRRCSRRCRSRSSPSARSSPTIISRSRAAWIAACGSSSRRKTASLRSRS
jgi:hypothetical protein